MKFAREKWILAGLVQHAASACNACRCTMDGEVEAINEDPDYEEDVAQEVAKRLHHSVMLAESLLDMATRIYKISCAAQAQAEPKRDSHATDT